MSDFSFEEENRFDRDYKFQQSYDKKIILLENQNKILLNLLKDAQKEIEWASFEMRGREPEHWRDVRNKLKVVIDDLNK
jgi:hypothetical protein